MSDPNVVLPFNLDVLYLSPNLSTHPALLVRLSQQSSITSLTLGGDGSLLESLLPLATERLSSLSLRMWVPSMATLKEFLRQATGLKHLSLVSANLAPISVRVGSLKSLEVLYVGKNSIAGILHLLESNRNTLKRLEIQANTSGHWNFLETQEMRDEVDAWDGMEELKELCGQLGIELGVKVW